MLKLKPIQKICLNLACDRDNSVETVEAESLGLLLDSILSSCCEPDQMSKGWNPSPEEPARVEFHQPGITKWLTNQVNTSLKTDWLTD